MAPLMCLTVNLNMFLPTGRNFPSLKLPRKTLSAQNPDLKRYEMIARNFPDGTINVLNRELKYVFANGKELSKFEIAPEDLIGTEYLVRFPVEKRDNIRDILMDVFERKSLNVTFEFNYRGLL